MYIIEHKSPSPVMYMSININMGIIIKNQIDIPSPVISDKSVRAASPNKKLTALETAPANAKT